MSIFCLPLEIIELILLKLPVESLLSLKFVNKNCFQFISSSEFVIRQLKHSSDEAILSNTSVIVTSDIRPGPCVSIERISILQLLQQPSIDSRSTAYDVLQSHHKSSLNSRDIDFYGSPEMLFQNGLSPLSLFESPDIFAVVGSCNGLMCIVTKENNDCLLWNPCTGKSKLLCSLQSDVEDWSYEIVGFGYDECHNDYKVVASCAFDERYKHVSRVGVFSLKRKLWRRITGFEGWELDNGASQFASGNIYWLARHCDDSLRSDRKIVSLDLEAEEFEPVEQPPNNYDETNLSVLDSHLCAVCSNRLHPIDLWVMKKDDYDFRKRWTKLVSIPYPITRWLGLSNLRPFYMLPNGEILFDDTESFLVYNPEHTDFRRIQFVKSKPDVRSERSILPIIHVQTLVSHRTVL